MKNSSRGTEFVAGDGGGSENADGTTTIRRRRRPHGHISKKSKKSTLAIFFKHLKLIRNQKKLLKETVESQAEVITKLKSNIEELKHTLDQQTATITSQNTRLEAAENHVISIYTRDMAAILARRGSRSGSNQTSPNQTSAFM
ncbi:hypothetical protein ACFE04_029253 [Oxalis oulophora]